MKNPKTFSTLAVAGVYSGYILDEKGFNAIHEVLDHLYPGIMLLGSAAMMSTASAFLAKQLPQLAELGKVENGDWQAFANKALVTLGPTLTVLGPHEVSKADVSAAAKRFLDKET